MYKFMSNYYEKEITLYPRDKKTLFNLYTQVSKIKKRHYLVSFCI